MGSPMTPKLDQRRPSHVRYLAVAAIMRTTVGRFGARQLAPLL